MKKRSLGQRAREILGDGIKSSLSQTASVIVAVAPGLYVQLGTETCGLNEPETMRCSDTSILEVRKRNFIVKVYWRYKTLELLQWVKGKIHLSKTPVSRSLYVQWTFTCSLLPSPFLGVGTQELRGHSFYLGKNEEKQFNNSRSALGAVAVLWPTSGLSFLSSVIR